MHKENAERSFSSFGAFEAHHPSVGQAVQEVAVHLGALEELLVAVWTPKFSTVSDLVRFVQVAEHTYDAPSR